MIDLTGPSRPMSAQVRRLWTDAADVAGGEYDAWQTAPAQGDPMLRARLGAVLNADPGQLLVTAGTRAAAAVLARRCRRVVIEAPTFAGIPNVFRDLDCHVTLCPWEAMAQEQERSRVDLVWLTSPCRNPDGRNAPSRLLHDVIKRAETGWVVVNEVYRWYSPVEQAANCMFVGSFSKLTGGGGRVGWLRTPGAQPELTATERASLPAAILQRTWAHFLASGGLRLCRAAAVEPTQAATVTFLRAADLPNQDGHAPPFLAFRGGSCRSEEALVRTLAEQGLRAGPGADFLATSPTVRVCFTGVSEAEARLAGERMRPLLAKGVIAPLGPREDA